jgi:hypothetical protein
MRLSTGSASDDAAGEWCVPSRRRSMVLGWTVDVVTPVPIVDDNLILADLQQPAQLTCYAIG